MISQCSRRLGLGIPLSRWGSIASINGLEAKDLARDGRVSRLAMAVEPPSSQ